MNNKWFLIIILLFGTGFGCQGLAQKTDEIKQNDEIKQKDETVKSDPVKLTLNTEDQGTTADTSVLVKKLKEVFQDRAENGVFRQGSNEVEKTVYLQGDRTVPAEEIANVFGAMKSSGASPILIPVLISSAEKAEPDARPNPLMLRVYAGAGNARGVRAPVENLGDPENSSMFSEIEISFMGDLLEEPTNAASDNGAVAVVVDKNGAFTLDKKQVSAGDLKTEIEKRLKTKEQDKKIVYVRAENYGNIEDAAGIAASAGAVKVVFIAKNSEQKEFGISFSLPPAFQKDKDQEQIEGYPSARFTGSDDSSFEITVSDELLDKERAESEISEELERKKETFDPAGVSLAKIDGASGVLTISKEDVDYAARWFGFREKNGKQQMVTIRINSPSRESDYSHYEFLQIMNSIKFN